MIIDQFSRLSIIELVERVAKHSDSEALNHFLTKRKLLWYEGERCILYNYLSKLRQNDFRPYIFFTKDEKKLEEKLDIVYDHTIKKFSQLKPEQTGKQDNGGPYCNNQYREFYELYYLQREVPEKWLALESEEFAEKIFFKLIKKHLMFSWREACRIADQFNKRYRWELPTGTLELKRPHWLKGNDFRKWLETHIDNPDPQRDGEKDRIQEQVFKELESTSVFSYDEIEYDMLAGSYNPDPIHEMELSYFRKNFYQFIADEKANNSNNLRPAIRRLGSKKIRELVFTVLDNFTNEDYRDTITAQKYGLSKSTFHRFAGSKWLENKSDNDGRIQVPDLWNNIAKVINSNPRFVDVVTSFGKMDIIEKT